MKHKKAVMIMTIALLSLLLVAVLTQHISLKQRIAATEREEEYLGQRYDKQNFAFMLPIIRTFVPYANLRLGYGEMWLFAMITWYNIETGSDLELYDVWEYLSCSYEVYGEFRNQFRVYDNYERIKRYVEFMDEKRQLESLAYGTYHYQFKEAFWDIYLETIQLPEFQEYAHAALPYQIVKEIVHKTLDSDYEMNLTVTDERYYMYLGPEALSTGRNN